MSLIMAVSADEYELPLYVAESCAAMERHYGLPRNTVSALIRQREARQKRNKKNTPHSKIYFCRVDYD